MPQSQAEICQQSREGAEQMRVVQQQRRRRDGRGEIVGARGGGGAGDGVGGGGADQCLDGSQYHKNSERVGRCWWSSWRGDGGGGGDAGGAASSCVGLASSMQAVRCCLLEASPTSGFQNT